MKHLHALWTACAASLILSACGGSDSPAPPAPAPAPTPAPAPAPAPAPGVTDRIEPLDTAGLKQAAATLAEPSPTSRLPADAVVPQIVLGPFQAPKQAVVAAKGAPLQIGLARAVDATAQAPALAAQLRWRRLADGTQVAALAFSSGGAKAIRLGLQVLQLPAGAVLRFYGAAGSPAVAWSAEQLAAWQRANVQGGQSPEAARTVWGPDTAGPLSTLELQLPPGATPAELQLAVPQLSHFTQTVEQAAALAQDPNIGRAGACTLDVMCSPQLDAESRSVARIVFTEAGSSFLCTGTLLNDARGSRTPNFLTAAHCISNADGAASVISYWFFRAASCNASPALDPAAVQVTGGARLLFTDSGVDSTLLQLNAQPPANVVYAGSYFGSSVAPGTGIVGVSNPSGDLQKYSVGNIAGYANCDSSTCAGATVDSGSMWQVGWTQGTTEGGSSGSAIWTQLGGSTRYVVGALHGGSASCQNPQGADFFGRFDRAYYRGIGSWLTR